MRKINSLVLLFTFLCFSNVVFSSASNNSFLGDRHCSRGVSCEACHGDSKSGEMLLDNEQHEACVACHGWYDQIAEKTVPENPDDMNPHNQHDGNLPCTECHKGHKASVNYCSECHYYTFDVP